ncbi:hypothetical protein GCM10010250_36400 [Streptomyces althioticus]|nr:hypothetical protein GCM10010250_36400 [Streptomyces althioticus]
MAGPASGIRQASADSEGDIERAPVDPRVSGARPALRSATTAPPCKRIVQAP